MAKPAVRTKTGKFARRIFQGKSGRWFFRRKDGKTVFASKKQVDAAKKRAVAKEKKAQAENKRRRRLKELLRYTGKELREKLAEEKRAKRVGTMIAKQEANRRIRRHLLAASPHGLWSKVDVSYYAGTGFYHRTWTAEGEPIHYAELADALELMRTDDTLSILMANIPMGWCSVQVTDPALDGRIGDDGGHSLSSAEHWDVMIEQAISNPGRGAEHLAEQYRQSLVSSFTITHYKIDPAPVAPKRRRKKRG